MTSRSRNALPGLALLFAWIFAFVTSACGGGSAFAPAKSASGSPGLAVSESEAPAEPAAASDADEAGFFEEKPTAQAAPGAAPQREVTDAPSSAPSAGGAVPDPPSASVRAREPLLIYTATMTLAVFGAREAIAAVEELARASGGYLVSRGDATVTIRVPTRAFQGALGSVSKLGDELHREVNVRDVTEQYADLEVRLKNAEAVRQRLEALLAKAAKIEDALAVERELERLTQTIEQLKGRLRLLSELVAFSTITVNFRARPQDQVGSEVRLPFPWLNELGLVPLMNLEEK
jgi:hypothetical protein